MSQKLSPEQISARLGNWKIEGDKLEKEFTFKDFKGSIKFINEVAKEAEKKNHHPEIEINYNKVEIELTTHSEGGITAKDVELAQAIEEIYDKY